jgi:transcriptional regulator
MYLPSHFKEDRPEVLIPLMMEYPLGTLVTIEEGIAQANHLPWLYVEQTLQAHIPKANPLYPFLQRQNSLDVLVIFHGPQAYVTPSWYPSKKATGKVVPTWNYSVIHVRGKIHLQEDPRWIRQHLEANTNLQEASRNSTWQVSDAPTQFTDAMISVLAGLEVRIESFVGKLKLSQNRTAEDRQGVMEHLAQSKLDEDVKLAQLAQQTHQ